MRQSTLAAGAIALASFSIGRYVQPANAQPDERAQAELRRMVDYLDGLTAFSFDLNSRNATTADGLILEYSTRYAITIARPNRYALRQTGGMAGPEYICDGSNLTVHMTNMHQYQVLDAPTDAMTALDPDRLGYLGEFYRPFLAESPGMRTLLSNHPGDVISGVVDKVTYVGLEEIEGVSAHHLRVKDSSRGHDLWIAAQGSPYPVRFSFEPSTGLEWDPTEFWSDPKTVHSITLTHWNGSPNVADSTFAFAAPDDSTEVDDLASALMGGMDGGGEEEAVMDLLGTPAPAFELASLDGTKVSLASLLEGDRVVVLDFWATWCPPCREGLPVITKTMQGYPEDKAVFYAVNLMEDADTARKFLEGENLAINVLLDLDGSIANDYGVTGIPQTVVIGKDGTIQSIHVGFMPGVGDQLKSEVDALLAGESLVEARERKLIEALDVANLDKAWTIPGAWQDVATDASGVAYALNFRGNRLVRIAPDGNVASEVRLQSHGSALRLARLVEGATDPAAIVFGQWGQTVEAFAADGSALWNYNIGDGVDDVWTADLDGDELDEVIIGYNGFTGLHVLTPEGELLWKNTTIGNVWHVTAADVTGDGLPEVITTSAEGKVHVFRKDGSLYKNFSPIFYANMVRAVSSGDLGAGAIYVGGTSRRNSEAVAKMALDGRQLWSLDLPGEATASILSMAVNDAAPVLAVTTRNGNLYLMDSEHGEIVGKYADVQPLSGIAWMNGESAASPLLLIATGNGLIAVRQKAKE